jgi:hypothetical protein
MISNDTKSAATATAASGCISSNVSAATASGN